ncbi:hypothetical protein ACN38_g4965 [Penicillium nordicum]|uniref:Uncharacterized protein n=1 Tax=Penicillium nordicum TaxID=229535 RepID=A0A0M9WGN0_9EURO|nr:hypothetical protein ACN38_g4965 [Penicillium nordicum]
MPACDLQAENSLPLAGLPEYQVSAQLSPTHYELRSENQEAQTPRKYSEGLNDKSFDRIKYQSHLSKSFLL